MVYIHYTPRFSFVCHFPFFTQTAAFSYYTFPLIFCVFPPDLHTIDCSICGEGYTEQLGFHCGKCPENSARGIAVAVVLAVVVLAVAAAVVSYLMSGEAGVSRERGAIECVTQYIPLQSVKIVIVAWQILTQVGRGTFYFSDLRTHKVKVVVGRVNHQ